MSSSGLSVARANAARVSMIRFTQMATVLPHLMALTIDEKSSVVRMISEASLATSVPAIPMEKPTSASFNAGASLVPSPVTATTSPCFLKVSTNIRLSSGLDRASTQSLGTRLMRSCGLKVRKTGPSMHAVGSLNVSSLRIPQFLAMARAVKMLSPVTILTRTPAVAHLATASFTPSRRGSWIPTRESKTNPSRFGVVSPPITIFGRLVFWIAAALASLARISTVSPKRIFGSASLLLSDLAILAGGHDSNPSKSQ
ncbi:hypothetical protein OGATHE_003345 [Ogataea polymorpha]|uniref:Uncharacterized protein n=1 Tax=Ogataea polymorpha TaxID=460523 RepID=A0A9P8P3G5_9ASCO|nr:hypothetical protein OGATHE_003345 [Ogataea polymorpha]